MPPCHRMRLSSRNPWRAESSASVVRRASCTLAPFRHSQPVPFLIRAKNIFSESDFSWAYCFHSHFHQSTAVTDNFQQISIQCVSPSISLDKLFLVIITCYRQTTSANSSGWLTMIAPDWHCQTYKKQHGKMVTNKLYYDKITSFICINDNRWNTVERCHLKAEAINFFHPKQVGKILAILP